MKASELIEDLQKFIEMYGDMPVSVYNPNLELPEKLSLVYGLVPITDEDNSDPKEFVVCCEELYDVMYETSTAI